MKERSEVLLHFKHFCSEIKTQFGLQIKTFRSDNAKEYFNHEFDHFLTTHGIIHQSSCHYTPQQNGVAERKNQHLLEIARTLLIHMNMPKQYWGDAVLTACHLINRTPSTVLDGKTPISVLYPSKPAFPLPLHIFGCVCFVHNNHPNKSKLDPRAIKCVFLGYSRTQKGYKCYCPLTRKTFVSADVTFFDNTSYFPTQNKKYFSKPETNDDDEDIFLVSITSSSTGDENRSNRMPSEQLPTTDTQLKVYTRRPKQLLPQPTLPVPTTAAVPTPGTSPSSDDLPIALRKGTRSCTRHPIANFVTLSHLSPSYRTFVTSMDSHHIPKSWSEALSHPGWKAAMQEEMQALKDNQTWELVTLPPGKKIVGCKWVFTVKLNPDGSLSRLKARLVAKGYSQTYGIDYVETFSPVAKMTSVRLLISLAAHYAWPLYQLDVKNAFLHGMLEEEVYMEQPPGFVAQGESGKVCHLKRALYGLKQSPRAWFGKFAAVVQEFGLQRSSGDYSVFFRTQAGKRILLVVYVDDIVITGDDASGICALKKFIQQRFQTKDLGDLHYFLGIEIARSTKGIFMSQRKYTLDVLSEVGLLGCKPADAPMDPNHKLMPGQGELLHDPGKYRRLVGKLNYLTVTRPDIAYSVSVVSQFMAEPRTTHLDAVMRILRYLKGSPGKGMLYSNGGHLRVAGFSDADWAGSPADRRSTTGYCVFVGGNLVSWKSKKQTVVSRSSAESEYRAMADITCEMIWIQRLLKELGCDPTSPMRLYCDNQAALHIANNPVFHERTKHIEVDCHIVRNQVVEQKNIETRHVASGDQLADILTKSLGKPRVQFICNKLGMYDIYAPV